MNNLTKSLLFVGFFSILFVTTNLCNPLSQELDRIQASQLDLKSPEEAIQLLSSSNIEWKYDPHTQHLTATSKSPLLSLQLAIKQSPEELSTILANKTLLNQFKKTLQAFPSDTRITLPTGQTTTVTNLRQSINQALPNAH